MSHKSIRLQLFKQFLPTQASVVQYPFAAMFGHLSSASTHLIPAKKQVKDLKATKGYIQHTLDPSYLCI